MQQVKVILPALLANIFLAVPDNVLTSGAENEILYSVPIPIDLDTVYTSLDGQDWGNPLTPSAPIIFIVPAPAQIFPPPGPTYFKRIISPRVSVPLTPPEASALMVPSANVNSYLTTFAMPFETASALAVFYTRRALRTDGFQQFFNQSPLAT